MASHTDRAERPTEDRRAYRGRESPGGTGVPAADAEQIDNPEVLHEESDVNIRAILMFGVGLLVTAVIIHLLTFMLFRFFQAQEVRRQGPAEYPLAVGHERLPPEPRLQVNPREDLRELRVKEDEILNSYGWVDRNAGVVRIPIEQAMKLTVQRGLPARQQTNDGQQAGNRQQANERPQANTQQHAHEHR